MFIFINRLYRKTTLTLDDTKSEIHKIVREALYFQQKYNVMVINSDYGLNLLLPFSDEV